MLEHGFNKNEYSNLSKHSPLIKPNKSKLLSLYNWLSHGHLNKI